MPEVEVQRLGGTLEVFGRVDSDHSPKRLRLRDVDGNDPRVRERASHECGVQHARQSHIVDVAPPSDQDAPVLDALDAAPHELPHHRRAHVRAPAASVSAASCTPSTMLWYPVQRQRLEATAARISSIVGLGLSFRNA